MVDAWHRRGVGCELVRSLIRRAGVLGINRLYASVIPENTAALGLFRALFPLCLTRRGTGVVELVGLLGDAGDWQITMDDVLSDLLS